MVRSAGSTRPWSPATQHPQNGQYIEGLEYRGLTIGALGKEIDGFQEILVSNGLVVARRESQSQQFVDSNRVLEKWLFQTGKGRLDHELYRQISGSIE